MSASADPSSRFVLPHDSPLVANLAALWAADPTLAADLEVELTGDPYPVEPSRAGPPTVALPNSAGGRIYLHSRYQPIDEAKRLVESTDLSDKTVLVVQGFGLGYHVEQLFDEASDEAILVIFEPDLRLLRTAFGHRDFSRLLRGGRVMFITRPDRTEIMLRLGDRPALVAVGIGYLSHPPSVQLHDCFHRQVQGAMAEFLAYCQTGLNTLVLNSRRTCENIARNASWYVATPGINTLKNRHANQPAIIISAGPSLRKNKHLLKDASGKAVLIAVQTTLQPLLEMGIEPDYVTSLDYHDICTRFFEKLPKNLRTELIAEPKASTAVLDLYPGPMRILGNEFADQLLREIKLEKDRLRAGATVAHLAFYLAEYMGCDPVIFVGQDLGFSDGLCYTPGTSYEDVWRPELNRFCSVEMKQWEHIARERPILRRIEDHQGNPMYTEERLFTYLQQFERDFSTTRCRVIDATEGGAKKRGATVMPLAAALASLSARHREDEKRDGRFFSPPQDLGSKKGTGDVSLPFDGETGTRLDSSPCEALCRWRLLPAALQSLHLRKEESLQIQQISRETLPLLRELRSCLDDQPQANRLIAAIDALHSRMNDLNHCYELVTLMNQQTELARFRSDRLLAASKLAGIERQRRQLDRDIANVQGVIDAAQQFHKLMDDVIARLTRIDATKRKAHAA
jgi:hypothetical protein